jgi:hypothetical protein
MPFVGLDLHKRYITVCALDAEWRPVVEVRRMPVALDALLDLWLFPRSDLYGRAGRAWLATVPAPPDPDRDQPVQDRSGLPGTVPHSSGPRWS